MFCAACSRWADGMRRTSRRHCERINNAGPRECDFPHDPADVPLREAVATIQRRPLDSPELATATVSLVSRAEREAPRPTRRRRARSESPPPGWAPECRDPDLHPMDALLAASHAEVPGCDLVMEKTWLVQKSFKVDGIYKKELLCSLCNCCGTKRHRLSQGHVDRIASYGDHNTYMRVKAEPRQLLLKVSSSSSAADPVCGGRDGCIPQCQCFCRVLVPKPLAPHSSIGLCGLWSGWPRPMSAVMSCGEALMSRSGNFGSQFENFLSLPCQGR